MLYSLLASTILLAFLLPFFSLYFFKMGVKYGIDKKQAVKEDMKPQIRLKRQDNKEIKRINKIIDNIDNYSGDSRNQKRV